METSYMNVSELRLGKVLAENIFANTQYPIALKDTKLTHEHIEVFQAFNILSVLVYKDLQDYNEEELTTISNEQTNFSLKQVPKFEKLYETAVEYITHEFRNWQAGAKIDVPKLRENTIPLIESILENRSHIFDLNTYSSPDEYIYHHCIATGLISALISQKLGYERGICIQMALAGILADCGMSKIPPRIRNKKSTLNEQEYLEIRKHPIYSYQIVKDLPAFKTEMKLAIFQHHERLDRSGYPKGSRSEEISNYAQIIAVADMFHAMTSERLYRSKQSTFKVIEMIKEENFGKFNIQVVQALIDIVADLPIGTHVELSNYEQAEVMFINPYEPTRPLVKLLNSGEIIDLALVRNYYITKIITRF